MKVSEQEVDHMDSAGTILPRCLSQVQGDIELLRELLEMLPACMEDLTEALKEAIRRDDREGARAAAHSMKGMLANIGFDDLAEKAYSLERLSLEGAYRTLLGEAEELSRMTCELVRNLSSALEDTPCGS